ncbi:MAG: hypothetical protein WCT04_00820 [Planctomycetota bacterium]
MHIDGSLGKRIDANITNRLLKVDTVPMLASFHNRPGEGWVGEHIGKWIHAATLAWVYTGNTIQRCGCTPINVWSTSGLSDNITIRDNKITEIRDAAISALRKNAHGCGNSSIRAKFSIRCAGRRKKRIGYSMTFPYWRKAVCWRECRTGGANGRRACACPSAIRNRLDSVSIRCSISKPK